MDILIQCKGFRLRMRFDPDDELDQEILAEAYMILLRRAKEARHD